MKNLLILSFALLSLTLATPARANCGHCAMKGKPAAAAEKVCPHGAGRTGGCPHAMGGAMAEDDAHGDFFLDAADELKLTESQVAKLNRLRVDFEKAMFEIQHSMWKLYAEVGDLSRAEKPNRRQVEAKADEIGKLKAKAVKTHFNARMDAKAVLTPEQLKALAGSPGSGT